MVLTITVDPVPGYFEQSRSICQIALFILRVKIVIGEVSLAETWWYQKGGQITPAENSFFIKDRISESKRVAGKLSTRMEWDSVKPLIARNKS